MPLPRNVHITDFKQPADGAAIFTLCPHCRKLEVLWSDIALKPLEGIQLFNTLCAGCGVISSVVGYSVETLHFPLEWVTKPLTAER